MSEIQLFFWGINAAIIFVVLFVVLIIALWVVNKWILKGKIRLLYRVLISIGIPLILIGWDYYSTNRSFYSSSNMDKLLDGIGTGITLPPYKITNYKNEHVMADDFKDTSAHRNRPFCVPNYLAEILKMHMMQQVILKLRNNVSGN